jgi:type VI secretion system FHA domain protein
LSLTLTIVNMDRLDNGEPTRLTLDKHGAIIGRSPHADWSLPDPKTYISSTHCEIDFRDGAYWLFDKSTNGTIVNGAAERMSAPHQLQDGDEIGIGHYRIQARLAGAGAAQAAPKGDVGGWGGWEAPAAPYSAPAAASGWDAPRPNPAAAGAGWDAPSTPAPAAAAWAATPTLDAGPASLGAVRAAPTGSGWDAITPASNGHAPEARAAEAWESSTPAMSGRGAMSQNWAAPRAEPSGGNGWGGAEPAPAPAPAPAAPAWSAPEPAPAASGWGTPAAEPSSDWGAATPAAEPAGGGDVWGKFAASNTVDWGRGGFGAEPAPVPPPPAPAPAPRAVAPAPAPAPAAVGRDAFGMQAEAVPAAPPAPIQRPPPPPQPAAAPAQPAAAPPTATGGADGAWQALLAAAGVDPALLKTSPDKAAAAAGTLLRNMTAGLVVMLEARARAKAQLGAQSTTLEFDGNNPFKFARSPDRVLAQLLNPPERGFMPAERAIEDSFQDLQAHQMATLAAMQGALRSTLERFSPDAIRQRADTRGVLAKIMPGARNAALWEAYEKEFEGVAKGSDEAFMDVFAKAFKAAYEKSAAEMKRGR